MRRKDKELTGTKEIEAVLESALICRLGMIAGGEPYVVPMNFAYAGGRLYFHSAAAGRKIEALRTSPRVCFEAEAGVEVYRGQEGQSSCSWSMSYYSVIGYGSVRFIDDPEEKRNVLDRLATRLGAPDSRSVPFVESEAAAVCIFAVEIESWSAQKWHK